MHFSVRKILTRLLDSFQAVNCIHSIPTDLSNEDYCYFSFDLTSLFTNVPLNKTFNIILYKIY